MKINYGDKLIIYLNNNYLKQKNINVDNIENCFYSIFEILKEKYEFKLSGLYDVDIYIDFNYGIVIEFIKQDIDMNYYDQIDMQIRVIKNDFLIKIDDLEPFVNSKVYKYKNEYYSNDLDKIEFGELIYDTNSIINHSIKVEI